MFFFQQGIQTHPARSAYRSGTVTLLHLIFTDHHLERIPADHLAVHTIDFNRQRQDQYVHFAVTQCRQQIGGGVFAQEQVQASGEATVHLLHEIAQ